MVFQVKNIVRDVKLVIDQNRTDTPLLASAEPNTLMLDELIESNITKAVDRVHSIAPYHLLEQGHNFRREAEAIYWGDLESGWVLLPPDFMRLVIFRMSDWERPVYNVLSADDKLYKRMRSRVKAVRGTAQRPVCVVTQRPEGKALEFYSCKSEEATVTQAVYIPYSRIDRDGGVDISKRCYDAVTNMAAGLVLLAINESERGAAMLDMAKSLL